MADFKLGDTQVLTSPFRQEKVKITITHTVKEEGGKTKVIEVPLADIIARVREKYAKDDEEQTDFFDTIEPFILVGSFVCISWGSHMNMSPAFLLTFMKGFLLGRVFGKNELEIELDREGVDADEYREYLAKLLAEKAQEMGKFAKEVASGNKEISFLDAALLSAEDS